MKKPSPDSVAWHLQHATDLLAGVSETPRLDAEILLTHVMGISKAALFARLNEKVEDTQIFEHYLQRRIAHEPIAYILGEWEFFSLPLHIKPPLLVPRPETEHLVEAVLDFVLQGESNEKHPASNLFPVQILDLCTGTGCVAVALAVHIPHAIVMATDIHPVAVEVASLNAKRNQVAEQVLVSEGDLFEAVPEQTPPFDVICANPPYVAENEWSSLPLTIQHYEDRNAVVGGADPDIFYKRIISGCSSYLRRGGMLAFEVDRGQADRIIPLLEDNSFHHVVVRSDLAGIKRVVSAIRKT